MSVLQEDAAAAGGRPDEPTRPRSAPPIDLRSCPPGELSAWLLTHRFRDNAMDVASFLLTCTSTLPDAEKISAQLLGGGAEDDDDDDDDDVDNAEMEDGENEGEDGVEPTAEAEEPATEPEADPQSRLLHCILSSSPLPVFASHDDNEIEVSCTNPRGKFLLSMHENGVLLTNPKKREEEQIPISAANVQNVVWFRKPEDYKKVQQLSKNGATAKMKGVPGHMVLVCLDGITFRNKPLQQVCFQLPSYPLADDGESKNKQIAEEVWWNGLSSVLFSRRTNDGIVRVHASMEKPAYSSGKTHGFVFESEGESGSATTTQAMPYVGCYQGFNDGALFPLREGLLFFKPPLFVPRSNLASITCGRGSGGSRYVDMVVQLDSSSNPADEQESKKKKKSDNALEFTNIHRDELTGLNDYIHKTLIPAMQMDADEADDDGSSDDDDDAEEAVAEVVNTSDDAEDETNSDGDDEEEEAVSNKRRPSRAASKSAREITRSALRSAAAGEGDDDDGDSDEFEEEGESDSDESVASDGESDSGSSDDEGFGEEEADDGSDGSDYEDRKPRKKARVE